LARGKPAAGATAACLSSWNSQCCTAGRLERGSACVGGQGHTMQGCILSTACILGHFVLLLWCCCTAMPRHKRYYVSGTSVTTCQAAFPTNQQEMKHASELRIDCEAVSACVFASRNRTPQIRHSRSKHALTSRSSSPVTTSARAIFNISTPAPRTHMISALVQQQVYPQIGRHNTRGTQACADDT
jgi:hypothetical protein